MRKLLIFLLLLFAFSCSTPKPEGLILKVQFQPEKTYQITTIRGTETVITYSGEDFAMRKLKSMNVKNPTTSTVRTKTDTELKIGKAQSDSICPITLTFNKTMSLDGKNQIPEGTVISGEIKSGDLPTFKSVTSTELDFDQKIQLLQLVRNSFDQFKFPDQRLKIGDEFSVDRPQSMAMEGSEIETVVTTTYKLISIQNDIAQFDLVQTYLMTPTRMDNSFSGTGNGIGKMSYNTDKMIVSEYSLKTEITMNKKLDYFEFDLKTINEMKQSINLK